MVILSTLLALAKLGTCTQSYLEELLSIEIRSIELFIFLSYDITIFSYCSYSLNA